MSTPAPAPAPLRPRLDALARATAHAITADKPTVNFFSGPLMGNGGLGVVLRTRPDAVVAHFGHNAVWDIRLAEAHREELGTFASVYARVKQIPAALKSLDEDPWFKQYCTMAADNYSKPYPRPMPCGTVIFGFDRRTVELLGHRLDIATGICDIFFTVDGQPRTVRVYVDANHDRLWLAAFDAHGQAAPPPFNRVRLLPDDEAAKTMPAARHTAEPARRRLSFRQVLPAAEPETYDAAAGHPADRAFRLSVQLANALGTDLPAADYCSRPIALSGLHWTLAADAPFVAVVQLDHGPAASIADTPSTLCPASPVGFQQGREAVIARWSEYWARSAVALDDAELERLWYRNLYFLACSVRAGVTCPGLFANWSQGNIGTAWHGDYHMNYNTQQPFWVTFSSNHVDRHLPYVDLVDHLLPVSRRWAQEYYGLRGAYFPHSAYPVAMTMLPYPVPTWGWEICETPWTVQSLWWHYRYTQDRQFLADRAFVPIREAVLFLVDYMRRPDAHGPQWGDDQYHVFPTVPPELYGLEPGFRHNADCLVDLTLIKFVLRAYQQACQVLDCAAAPAEAALLAQVAEVLAHFPAYPTNQSPRGEVFVSVPGENVDLVQNVPNWLTPVFPGEDVGLDSPPALLEIARNTFRQQQNEGGNDLVFLNLQAARLGLLDLERFKRQARYCELPNGTFTDNCLQPHGRYVDQMNFDWMGSMGIWFENFSLPAVVNECLLHGHTDTLRLFPNWPLTQPAAFQTLRTVGAFLVSAACADGRVTYVEVICEADGTLAIHNPWPHDAAVSVVEGDDTWTLRGPLLRCPAKLGQRFVFRQAAVAS